ncbi:Telomerase protein component 1, variant 2 [Purpureocillium takamizusanense]|nr:Telomerase protein component 1, variant 2 [Purpureocillium takamizusanense]UNI16838.1 Telomerase protein component 1, variant 2 [Purpureocillium takamizusanense]
MIMASMRNWLHGGELEGGRVTGDGQPACSTAVTAEGNKPKSHGNHQRKKGRVVVVHCKAGKGRSGTATCSYLISEEGWSAEDALARFTQRRMRPQFGAGVSIPSQLRWVSYVERWTRHGKKYVDRPVEIMEIHIWGLRNGVKVDVEGFVEDGRKIRVFHTFTKKERVVVEGGVPAGGGFGEMMWELAGYPAVATDRAPDSAELADAANDKGGQVPDRTNSAPASEKKREALMRKGTNLIQKVSSSNQGSHRTSSEKPKAKTGLDGNTSASNSSVDVRTEPPDEHEPGGMAVILKPSEPVRVPTSDVNISVERRNKTHKSMGLTMVSAVAHVWFNAFFEGQGPEQAGRPAESGVFSIEWDAMDGIKGSSRKGSRALDRVAVVWRFADGGSPADAGEDIPEPAEGEPVPQLQAADWKGETAATVEQSGGGDVGQEHQRRERERDVAQKDLGLRRQSPASVDVSRASSVRSADGTTGPVAGAAAATKVAAAAGVGAAAGGEGSGDDEAGSMAGVRVSGPAGEEDLGPMGGEKPPEVKP